MDIKGGDIRRLHDLSSRCDSLKVQEESKWTPRILIEGKRGICEWLRRMLKEEK